MNLLNWYHESILLVRMPKQDYDFLSGSIKEYLMLTHSIYSLCKNWNQILQSVLIL